MPFPVTLPPHVLSLATLLQVLPEDIEERFVRGSGAGGQKINKTASTVWLLHRPSGIEVRVQKHREQSKNRVSAYKLLILKIDEVKRGKESEQAKKIFKIRKQKQRRSKKAKEKMLQEKRRRGEMKEERSGKPSY